MAGVIADLTGRAALAAVLGAGTGIGLLLVAAGVRGRDPGRPRPRLMRRHPQAKGGPAGRQRMLRIAGAVTVGLVAAVASGWLVGGLLAGLGCWWLPRLLGPDRGQARRLDRIEAVATWTEMLRDILAAASGLEQAILATAGLAPPAITTEITGLAARLQRGQRLAPALRATAEELADPTADLVIAALVLAAEHQARQLTDLLGSLAGAAREQAAMRLRVEAGRARSRTSVRVIAGTTVVFAVALVVLDRPYLAAYDTGTGQLVLLTVGALFAVGFAWMTRTTAFAEPDRVLAPSDPPDTVSGSMSPTSVTDGASDLAWPAGPR